MALHFLGQWLRRTRNAFQRVRLVLDHLEDRSVPSGTDLGAATDFNAFIFGDYTASYTDAGGRVAVGHDAKLTGYGVGDALTNSHGTRDDLVVGHDLNYHQGEVFNGNAVYGNTAHISSVAFPHGKAFQQSGVVDFAAAQADLVQKSQDWGAASPNGTVQNNWGTLTLTGTDPKINIFSVTGAELSKANGLAIIAPKDSTVLINVSGTAPKMQNFGMWLVGTDANHVLFNFPDAKKLTIEGIGVEGSVLAPNASVSFNNGHLDGDLIAANLRGNGQLNAFPPKLDVEPPPPATASVDGSVFAGEGAAHFGIAKIKVNLSGTDLNGNPLPDQSTRTQPDGTFTFGSLPAGTYTLSLDLTGTSHHPVVPFNGIIAGIGVGVGQDVQGNDFQIT